MIREDRHPLHQLLHQHAPLLLLSSLPNGFDVQVPKKRGDLLETDLQIVLNALLRLLLGNLCPCCLDHRAEPSLLLPKALGTDATLVVQVQELAPLFRYRPQGQRRRRPAVRARHSVPRA
jgi:hypothetical protein